MEILLHGSVGSGALIKEPLNKYRAAHHRPGHEGTRFLHVGRSFSAPSRGALKPRPTYILRMTATGLDQSFPSKFKLDPCQNPDGTTSLQ